MGRLITSHGSSQYVEKTDKLWNVMRNEIDLEDIYDAANGSTEKIDQFFHSLKEFPEYRYVIVHLCDTLSLSYEKEEIRKLFEEIERGEGLSEASDEILTHIATILGERYEETTMESAPKVDVIKERLIHFDEEFLFKFLVWTAVEDDIYLDEFLTGVLKRQGIDYYDADEFLIYVAIRYEYVGAYSKYAVYKRLKEIYDGIPEPKKNASKNTAQGTLHIQKMSDDMLEGQELCIDEPVSEELYELLEWHKSLEKPDMRTIGKTFAALLEEVADLYKIDIDNFKRICKRLEEQQKDEKKKGQSAYLKKYHAIRLTVQYDGSVDESVEGMEEGTPAVVMKKGTEFSGKNFFYTLEEDVVFPRTRRVENVLVPVCSLSDIPAPGKDSTLPSDTGLWLCDKNGRVKRKMTEEFEVEIRTFPVGQSKNNSWLGKQKPAYNRAGDEKGKGYVLFSSRAGFQILKDETYFCYKHDGKTYLFAAKESMDITWKQDIFPHYFVKDVKDSVKDLKEQLEKKGFASQDMEEANISYKVIDQHKIDGHVTGLEQIVDITNEDKVVFFMDRGEDDEMDAEHDGAEIRNETVAAEPEREYRKPMQLIVRYPANCQVTLLKNTVFKADHFLTKGKPSKMKPEQKNSFYLANDETLPKKNTWNLSVQVVSDDEKKRPGATEEFLKPEKSTIRWERKSGNGTASQILSVTCSSKRPRLYRHKTQGYFDIVCECGTVIDDSIRFLVTMDGEEYIFRPTGGAVTASADLVEHTIEVYPVEENLFSFSTLGSGAKVIAKADTYYEAVGDQANFPKMQIFNTDKFAWEEKEETKELTPTGRFLEYLFSLEDYDSFSRYTPEIDKDNFAAKWFEDMFIEEWTEEEFCKLSPARARSVLVTLLFMKAAKEKENMLLKEKHAKFSEEYYKRFVRKANEVLESCRLYEFYPGRPCDCLLAYLYACDSPIDALRILFKLNKRGARDHVNAKP